MCIIAAAFGIADGHVQGGMTGDLSLMCPEFVQVPFYIIKVKTSIFTTIIWSGLAY